MTNPDARPIDDPLEVVAADRSQAGSLNSLSCSIPLYSMKEKAGIYIEPKRNTASSASAGKNSLKQAHLHK